MSDLKDICASLDRISERIEEGLEFVIYEMKCKECDSDLTYDSYIDSDIDMIISVEPCEKCMEAKECE